MNNLNLLDNSFSNVGTVVLYKRHLFLPDKEHLEVIDDQPDVFKSDLIKYYGSDKNFPSIDFAEYNFSYFPDKQEFRNIMVLSELDQESGEIVGKNIEDTSKISDILFPTLVNEETNNPYSYFGSLNIGERVLYFFEVPEDYATVEIYEDVISSNVPEEDGFYEYDYLKLTESEISNIPAAIIHLGPNNEVLNNPTSLYYKRDPKRYRVNRTGEELSTLEYSKLYDQVSSSKVITFFLSPSTDILEFNVSLGAFGNNINPLRNKWKYDLRNDELTRLLGNPGVLGTNGSTVYDLRSHTILGNTEIDSSLCPLKNKKMSILRRLQKDSYSPYRRYNKGDIANYNIPHSDGTKTVYVFESLVQGNLGNDPFLSGTWILKDKFFDFLTDIIYISSNPEGTGSTINPGTQITVRPDSDIVFSISEGVGYGFSGLSIILKETQETLDLIESEDYTYSFEETDTEYLKTVRIDNWRDFIDSGDPNNQSPKYTDNLIFGFTPQSSILKILARKSGDIFHYSDWDSELGLSITLRLGGNELVVDGEGSPLQVNNGDLFLFIPEPQNNPTIELTLGDTNLLNSGIESKYRIGSQKFTKTIEIIDSQATEVVNFSEATWTINLETRTRELNVRFDNNIDCNVSGVFDVNYGSTYIIPFTILNPLEYGFSISLVNYYYVIDGSRSIKSKRLVKYENNIVLENYPLTSSLILDDIEVVGVEVSSEDNIFYLRLSGITENTMILITGRKI